MKRIVLFSLVFTAFSIAMPFQVSALDLQPFSQNFQYKTTENVLLAQDRRHRDRQYSVYYRTPRDRQWNFDSSHQDRDRAERVARRLERRGYTTSIRVSREVNDGGRWDRDDRDRNR